MVVDEMAMRGRWGEALVAELAPVGKSMGVLDQTPAKAQTLREAEAARVAADDRRDSFKNRKLFFRCSYQMPLL